MVNTNTREYAMLKDLMGEVRTILLEIVEHRLGGARLLEPAHIFATEKGIIIIRGGVFGFHRSYKIIEYDHITEIRLARGPIFCRIHFSLQGQQEEKEDSQKWLVGIRYKGAAELIKIVNKAGNKPVQEVK